MAEQNFYTRLNALQILACILECRQEPLQECIMSSPTGISTLVDVLTDQREQIRNEGLLLLLKLVQGHTELQKRAAFENVFEKCFAILDEEGGLEGGIVTADCFTLLGNLLAQNASNQNWFREMGILQRITQLLQQIDKTAHMSQSLQKNLVTLFNVCRLFVPRQSANKMEHQDAAMKAGIVTQAVAFAFQRSVPLEIRAAALSTLADLMYGNQSLQEYFDQASALALDPLSNGERKPDDLSSLFNILLQGGEETFKMRYAALLCVEAFAAGNHARQLSVLQQIIDAFLSGNEGSLLEAIVAPAEVDEHRTWFACCALLRLTHDDEEAQAMFTELMIGDATAGEEELSFVQTLSGNLVASLQRERKRSAAAYLQLLCCLLYDAKSSVANFLEEGSTLQALLAELQNESRDPITKGLCASLLSICYAFNFDESSPLSRTALQPILLRIGRDNIVGAIEKFSFLEALRLSTLAMAQHEQAVLDDTFIDFFRDEYGTIRKAIDVVPNPQKRRSREAQEELEKSEDVILDLQEQLEFKSTGLSEAINHLRTRQEELQRQREENKYLQQKHESSLSALQKELAKEREEVTAAKAEQAQWQSKIDAANNEAAGLRDALQAASKESASELEKLRERLAVATSKLEGLEAQLESEASKRQFLERELTAVRSSAEADAKQAAERLESVSALEAQIAQLEASSASYERRVTDAESTADALRKEKNSAEQEAAAARTKARDLTTDLKGAQQALESSEQAHAKELAKMQESLNEANRALEKAQNSAKNDVLIEQLRVDKKELEANIMKLQADNEKLQAADKKLEEQMSAAKRQNQDNAAETSASKIKQLEQSIKTLEQEKKELKNQLDQAQEDLMLLMEDADKDETNEEDVD